ncbi:MAG: hydantoinase/oxoprolinase family protein [Alsobacter sp.]
MAIHLACDVGGTFTDLVLQHAGGLLVSKAPSTPHDPVDGVIAAVSEAARELGSDRKAVLSRAGTFVHATTRAINALLTGRTARTALLVTAGHRDILLLREGGRLNPYDSSVEFPKPYVPRSLTFEIPERIGSDGECVLALDEQAVERVAARLEDERVEAIAVCLLWSTVNPRHEQLIGEILARRLPGVPVTLSHRLNPVAREYRRASSASIDASLKPLLSGYLHDLEVRLRAEGFAGRLLMATSQGGMVEVERAVEAPIHVLMSGPAMAPLAGGRAARDDGAATTAIVTDTGGTSFDVSLVRDGRVPWTSESWIGPRFTGDMTGFPGVDVKSIGAGGGSIAVVDAFGLLRVGPESAGAVPGPVCYARGGTRVTVTDCALVLGILDPVHFLGGRMALDVAAACAAVADQIGGPLGLGVEEAAQAVLDLLTQTMVAAIEEITVVQGIDPARAVLVAGGGAAGFNAVAMARRLGCRMTIIPAPGAALSAVGAVTSDLIHTESRVRYLRTDDPDDALVARTLVELSAAARRFADEIPHEGQPHVEFWAEARYPQQTWEIPVAIPSTGFEIEPDVGRLAADFHAAHAALYAVNDPRSPVEVIAWRVRVGLPVRADTGQPGCLPVSGAGGYRRMFIAGAGWRDVPVHGFGGIEDDHAIVGPCLLEAPYTTVVVPEGIRGARRPSGSIVLQECTA